VPRLDRYPAARGVAALVVFYALPVYLYASTASAPLWLDGRTSLGTPGDICGLVGLTAFACNVILGARLGFIQSFFGGLESMYRVHRRNGPLAFALLTAHAAFLIAKLNISPEISLTEPSVVVGFVLLTLMAVGIALSLFVRLGHEVFVYVQRAFGLRDWAAINPRF
jgi:predicted ferric reductase